MRLLQGVAVFGKHLHYGAVVRVPDADPISAGPFSGQLDRMGQLSEAQSVRMGDDTDEMAACLGGYEDVTVCWAVGHARERA